VEHEEDADQHPAEPEEVAAIVEMPAQQAMAKCVHKIIMGIEEAGTGDEQQNYMHGLCRGG